MGNSLPSEIRGHRNRRDVRRRLHRHLKAEPAGAITKTPDLAGSRPQLLFQQPCQGIPPGPRATGLMRTNGSL